MQARIDPIAHPLAWADGLRAAAILAVVVLHVSAPVVGKFASLDASAWWAGHLWDSLVRASVPLFFMLSGALLLGRREPLAVFFTKRLSKLVPPLIAWSAVYLGWEALRSESERPWWEYLAAPLHGAVYYHLWFLYEILRLYLVMPVLRVFVAHASARELDYFLLLWAVVALLYPLFKLWTGFRVSLLGLDAFAGYAGYMLLGYRLVQLEQGRVRHGLAAAAFALGWVATLWLTAAASASAGKFDGLFYEYLKPNVALMAAGAFWLMRAFGARLARTGGGMGFGARCAQSSFGIYLAHVLVLELLGSGVLGFRLDALSLHPALGIPLVAALVLGASLGLVELLKRVPGLRAIVP